MGLPFLPFLLLALLALVFLGAGLSRLIRALGPDAPAKGPGGPRPAAPPVAPQPLPPEFEGDPSLQWLRSLRDGDGGPRFR